MKDHPYKNFEESALWRVVEDAINNLVENDDLEEKTGREYIVGYIVKHIKEQQKKEHY